MSSVEERGRQEAPERGYLGATQPEGISGRV